MDKTQLRNLITKTLKETNLYSDSAVELLMLTAAVESNLGHYIRQIKGPALGIFQMEPATEIDIINNCLEYKQELARTIEGYIPRYGKDSLEWNLKYAILMARVHYLRVKEPLPPADDKYALATYWKNHYNTKLGKGTVRKALSSYARYCL